MYGDRYCTNTFGVKSSLVVEKVLLRGMIWSSVVSTTDATITAVESLIQSDRRVIGKMFK